MMQRDLMNAGAGPLHGLAGRTLANYLPPIVPARTGARAADPEGTAFVNRISITHVPDEGWSATLASDMASPDEVLTVKTAAGCPGAGICGFVPGSRAAIVDVKEPASGYELFSVTDLAGGLAHGAPNPPFTRLYSSESSVVVPVVHHVYYHDTSTNRLMLYDGYQSDVPLVDNVVALQFTYYADPNPASVAAPIDGAGNCAYAAGSPPVPLLQPLPGLTLVPLTTQQMMDGPFCGIGSGSVRCGPAEDPSSPSDGPRPIGLGPAARIRRRLHEPRIGVHHRERGEGLRGDIRCGAAQPEHGEVIRGQVVRTVERKGSGFADRDSHDAVAVGDRGFSRVCQHDRDAD